MRGSLAQSGLTRERAVHDEPGRGALAVPKADFHFEPAAGLVYHPAGELEFLTGWAGVSLRTGRRSPWSSTRSPRESRTEGRAITSRRRPSSAGYRVFSRRSITAVADFRHAPREWSKRRTSLRSAGSRRETPPFLATASGAPTARGSKGPGSDHPGQPDRRLRRSCFTRGRKPRCRGEAPRGNHSRGAESQVMVAMLSGPGTRQVG